MQDGNFFTLFIKPRSGINLLIQIIFVFILKNPTSIIDAFNFIHDRYDRAPIDPHTLITMIIKMITITIVIIVMMIIIIIMIKIIIIMIKIILILIIIIVIVIVFQKIILVVIIYLILKPSNLFNKSK